MADPKVQYISLEEQATTPGGTPPSGESKLWLRSSDGYIVYTDDSGTTTSLVGGGSGGVETLEETLALGNTTGNNDIILSGTGEITAATGVELVFEAGDAGVIKLNNSSGNSILTIDETNSGGEVQIQPTGANPAYYSLSDDNFYVRPTTGAILSFNSTNFSLSFDYGSFTIGSSSINLSSPNASGDTSEMLISTGNSTTGNSGHYQFTTGSAGGTGNTGHFDVLIGDATGTGDGGYVDFEAGDGASGGLVKLEAGRGLAASGSGGTATILGGEAIGTSGSGGSVDITSGSATNSGTTSGAITINTGDSDGAVGDLTLAGGQNTGSGNGGDILIYPGDSTSGTEGSVFLLDHALNEIVEVSGKSSADAPFTVYEDGYFHKKLTVLGIIDPTGLVLDEQDTVPGGTPDTGKATIWYRSSDGYMVYTDENGTTTSLVSESGGGGTSTLEDTLGIGNTTGNNDIELSGSGILTSSAAKELDITAGAGANVDIRSVNDGTSPGSVGLTAGNASSNGAGGWVNITAGDSSGTNTAGHVNIYTGTGSTAGQLRFFGGQNYTSGIGGGLDLDGGPSFGSGPGGSFDFAGGDASGGTGVGGDFNVTGGPGDPGGAITGTAGAGGGSGHGGGAVTWTGGAGNGAGDGGDVSLSGGAAPGAGDGGDITVTPGSSSSGTVGIFNVVGDTQAQGDIIFTDLNSAPNRGTPSATNGVLYLDGSSGNEQLTFRDSNGREIELAPTFLSIGEDVDTGNFESAQTGTIRLPNASSVYARNNALAGDIQVINVNASDEIIIGDLSSGTATGLILQTPAGTVDIKHASTTIVSVDDTSFTCAVDGYFNNDLTVSGKLTVDDIIDPTGLVLDEQATVPGGNPTSGKATIWYRSSDGYMVYTDENGTTTSLVGGSGGGGDSQDLQDVLSTGNITGGSDIILSTSDEIQSETSLIVRTPSGDNNSIDIYTGAGTSGVFGGSMTIDLGDGGSSDGDGGTYTLIAGAGDGTGTGGAANINAGASTSGTGGGVGIYSGNSVSGAGGNLGVYAGDTGYSGSKNYTGGYAEFSGADASGNGGSISIRVGGGLVGSDGNAGTLTLSGNTGDGYGDGGSIYVNATGSGNDGGDGGDVSLTGGSANGTTGDGGYASMTAGSASGSGDGGHINLKSGDSDSGDGGSALLQAGSSNGTYNHSGSLTRGTVIVSGGSQDATYPSNLLMEGTSAVGAGGSATLAAGSPVNGSNQSGGFAKLRAQGGDGTGSGGYIELSAGSGESGNNAAGGYFIATAGNAYGTQNGGYWQGYGGDANGTGSGGSIGLYAGDSVDGNSGDVNIVAGVASGSGDDGSVTFKTGGNDAFIIDNAGDGYFYNNLGIAGKLTVDGIIDPTGLVLDNQTSVPGGNPATGKTTIWVRESDGYVIATDENGDDSVLSGGGGGSSLTAPTVGENGYVAIASDEDLTYLVGDSDGDVLTWNEAQSAWESAAPAGNDGYSIITEWEEFTPILKKIGDASGAPTVSTTEASWRRVGDSIEVQGRFILSSGAGAGTEGIAIEITDPLGLTADSSKTTVAPAGIAMAHDDDNALWKIGVPRVDGSNGEIYIFNGLGVAARELWDYNTSSNPFVFDSGDQVWFRVTIAIEGWTAIANAADLLTQPTNTEDGYVAIASGEDLAYLIGNNDGDVLTWSEAQSAWESAAPTGGGGDGYSIITEWEAYTPVFYTSSGYTMPLSSSDGYWRRVGDTVEFYGNVILDTISVPSGDFIRLQMVTGLQTDHDKIGEFPTAIGIANTYDGSNTWGGVLTNSTPDDDGFWIMGTAGTAQGNTLTTQGFWRSATPYSWNSGDEITFKGSVPVVGWTAIANAAELATLPTNTEDGYVAIASGEDLTYLVGDNDGDVLTWSETNSQWESQTPSGNAPIVGVAGSFSTTETVATRIGGFVLNGSGKTSATFQAVMETDNALASCVVELFNTTDGSEVTSAELTSTATTAEKQTAALTLPSDLPQSEKIYEIRLKRSGGSSSDTVTCLNATLEVS